MTKKTPKQIAAERINRFSSISKSTTINLSEIGFSSIPDELWQLTNLTSLILYWNKLSTLPNEIERLSNLQKIHLGKNKIRYLPASTRNLVNLIDLNLCGNQLVSLQAEIGSLRKLESLDLSSNHLESLPPEIGKLINLTNLNLNDNKLKFVPKEIGNLTSGFYISEAKMNNLESDLRNLLARYSQKDLLGLDQIMKFSFALMSHPSPTPWVESFISKRHSEDLISLVLSLPIPTANFAERLQKSDMPEWKKEQISLDLAASAREIYNKLGSIVDVSNLENKMKTNEEYLQKLMQEDTWTRSLVVVKNYPVLLQLETDFAFASMEFSAFLANDAPAVDYFHAHRNLLADCRKASVDKVVQERYPFVKSLSDGLNETMMLVYSGIDGYGYGDIPFPEVYEYAKKIVKNPNNLISAKLEFAMGRYLQFLSSRKKWEEGKSLLDKVANWIVQHGDDYNDEAVLILDVQTRLLFGTYWKNLFKIEPKESYIDEAIRSIKSAIKIAPDDEDIIVIYSGFARTMFEKYQAIQKKQILIDAIDVLDHMIVLCERFESEHIYSGFYAQAVCYATLHSNHGDEEGQRKAKLIYEKILNASGTPENIKLAAKGALGRIGLAHYDDNHDLSSLDMAIKNLKESLGE